MIGRDYWHNFCDGDLDPLFLCDFVGRALGSDVGGVEIVFMVCNLTHSRCSTCVTSVGLLNKNGICFECLDRIHSNLRTNLSRIKNRILTSSTVTNIFVIPTDRRATSHVANISLSLASSHSL